MHLTGLDSSAVLVAAKPIDAKNIWGGMVLPVFPLFLIPRRHFYDEKNLLTIYLVPSTAKDLSILKTDIELYENGEIHTPLNMIYQGDTVSQVSIPGEHYDRWLPMFHHIPIQYYPNKLVLNFPVDGGSTEKFELRIKKISSGNKVAQMPLIAFQKKKQRFRIIGP